MAHRAFRYIISDSISFGNYNESWMAGIRAGMLETLLNNQWVFWGGACRVHLGVHCHATQVG